MGIMGLVSTSYRPESFISETAPDRHLRNGVRRQGPGAVSEVTATPLNRGSRCLTTTNPDPHQPGT